MATDAAVTLEKALEDVLSRGLEVDLPAEVEKLGGLKPASAEQVGALMDWGRKVMLLRLEYLKHERSGDREKRKAAERELIRALGEAGSVLKDSKLLPLVERVKRATVVVSRGLFTEAQVKSRQ